MSNLVYLDIDHCTSLIKVHESSEALARLKGCSKLQNKFVSERTNDTSMQPSESLIFLDLSLCNPSKIPDAIADIKLSNLAYLNLSNSLELSLLGEVPFDSGSYQEKDIWMI
ncbi:hypothetical protein Ahy_B08g093244 [Arachis hypogaea]|uniref:Uncharacterized protein n=1 Tax=Arachis hypogaea TaxID=3818 RepID=A0A444Y5M0_ARAHY|nr:hypothetical protein Ahy_B08g093244 [Arachis hypogaea]